MVTDGYISKFEARYIPEPNSGCWLWTGAVNHDGYGVFKADGKVLRAHRISYVMEYGEIPDGLQIDHLCKVRCCVNPAHLEPVTGKENTRRSDAGKHMRTQTHCRRGHRYDEATFVHPNGTRGCGTCRDERNRKRREDYIPRRPVSEGNSPND